VSKKGNQFDIVEVSNGISSFTLDLGPNVGDELSARKMEEGEKFNAYVHVAPRFGSLRGTIVAVE